MKVIGHEGEHSLLALLKKEELAEALSAGKSHMGAKNVLFEISISLTEHGLANVDLVIQRIFEGLATFRSRVFPEYIFKEINLMSKISYEYQQRYPSLATTYCKLARREGLETFPNRSYLISRFDPRKVDGLLEILKPQNSFITIVSKDNPLSKDLITKTEKWMRARYAVGPIEPTLLLQWDTAKSHPETSYPNPNPFIPDSLDLVPIPNDSDYLVPKILSKDSSGIAYISADKEFLLPKLCYSFNIKSPKIRPGNAKSTVLAELYLKFVNERLLKVSYDASEAGLQLVQRVVIFFFFSLPLSLAKSFLSFYFEIDSLVWKRRFLNLLFFLFNYYL